jgi:hypothetical protein
MLNKIVGDPGIFAIQYQPFPNNANYEPSAKMALCHMIINNQLIGNPIEECYLPSWLFNLTDRRNRIDQQRHYLFPKEFEELSDREIFESILKSNQLEEEFQADFLYLPQLTNEFWNAHHFTIDETIDRYLIYFYVRNDRITLLIEDDSKVKGDMERSFQFIFKTLDLNSFIRTIDEMTYFLLEQYPYLQQNVSDRKFPLK